MGRTRVGIREAKVNLSRYVRLVQKGGEVVITDRGRPVARIVPFTASELSLDERVERLVEQGRLEPVAPHRIKAIPPPIQVPGDAAQRMLREDRDA